MGPSTRSRTRVHDTDTLNKRRKVEQEQPEVSQEVVPQVGERHESLWFRDGNVVVAGQGKAFRVHSGILAFHSSVFKTLLSDPALAALPERLEGCPVLWTGDRSETLAQLLQIIYDGGKSRWFRREGDQLAFPELRTVALIAAKYQVQAIIDEVISRLSQHYPWRSLAAYDDSSFCGDADHSLPRGPVHIHCSDSVAVVPLVRLLNGEKLLSVALYECCRMSNLGLWACSLIYGNETVRFSNDDLETCLRGRSQLEKENTRIIKTLLEFQTDDVLQSVNCNTWERCHKAVALLVLTAAEGGLLNDASPLSCWDQWRDDMYIKDGNLKPCDLCDKALRRTIDDRREEVWQKLGKIFGVEPWPVVDAHHHEVEPAAGD